MPLGRAAAAYACVPIPPSECFLESNLRFISLTPYFCLIFSIVSVAEYGFKYVSPSGLIQVDGYLLISLHHVSILGVVGRPLYTCILMLF